MGVLRLGEVKTRTSGGCPFLHKRFIIVYPLFSLAVEAQRKKLGKKEHADKEVSPRARGDQTTHSVERSLHCSAERERALDGRSLFEKSDGKTFHKTLPWRSCPTDKSKFENKEQNSNFY